MKPAFRDRAAAGARLAAMLGTYRGGRAIVLAIPAGGVPVGAAAFDGSVWIDEAAVENSRLTKAQVEKAVADARTKVERRSRKFSSGKVLTDLSGKTVILVDDGIAAGSTMRTAIAALRKLGASRIVVAVPTAPSRSLGAMRKLADDILCVDIRRGASFAVADAYEEWRDLRDEEVEAMLQR